MRTLGADSVIDDYIEPLFDKVLFENNKIGDDPHLIAKYSLLLDILMGYSQINNYADTVVINNRSKREI
jgi:hypothetical protein